MRSIIWESTVCGRSALRIANLKLASCVMLVRGSWARLAATAAARRTMAQTSDMFIVVARDIDCGLNVDDV